MHRSYVFLALTHRHDIKCSTSRIKINIAKIVNSLKTPHSDIVSTLEIDNHALSSIVVQYSFPVAFHKRYEPLI